jgi:hypothetical protein
LTTESKRSPGSEQKTKLIEFFENFSNTVLEDCKIDRTSEMYTWNGTDWIDNINENNPVIITDIIDEFENIMIDEFENYAFEIVYEAGNYVYELCGVYWHVVVDKDGDLDYSILEVNGPSTDKAWIMGWMPFI